MPGSPPGAPKTSVTLKHCQSLTNVGGRVATGSGSLVFSPASIKYVQWRMTTFNFEKTQWSRIVACTAQELLALVQFSSIPKRSATSYVVVFLNSGEAAVFAVKHASLAELQNVLTPWLGPYQAPAG